jgi:hypothetical protein
MVIALSGCQFMAQKAVESATGVKVDKSGDQVTITGKDGQASLSASENKLPENLPDNVPVYDGTVSGSATMETEQGTAYTFSIRTSDDAQTIIDWYKKELADKGWTVKTTFISGDNGGVVAKSGDEELTVTISKRDDGKFEIGAIANVPKAK